ncbi:MAG: imidazoleglycerol-phosphate dehydratase, partial [Anaerovoracaceae bacterium]
TVGAFDTELAEEFMMAFSRELGLTLHFVQFAGSNSHHIIEAAFKGLGRALAKAVAIDEQYKEEIPSTKGVI